MKFIAFASKVIVLCALLLIPKAALAETHGVVFAGATCTPYPPASPSTALPYTFFMFGFSGVAYCHFEVPGDWNIEDLSYVQFTGNVSGAFQPLRARLCVWKTFNPVSCGIERTIGPGAGTNWVEPPFPLPAYISGAYLEINFPEDQVTTFQEFIVVWQR
jgi:hypothetical protein